MYIYDLLCVFTCSFCICVCDIQVFILKKQGEIEYLRMCARVCVHVITLKETPNQMPSFPYKSTPSDANVVAIELDIEPFKNQPLTLLALLQTVLWLRGI